MMRRTLGTTACCLTLLAVSGIAWGADPIADPEAPPVDHQGIPLTEQGQTDYPTHTEGTIDIANIGPVDTKIDGHDTDMGWTSVTPYALTLEPSNGRGESRSATLQAFHNGSIIYFYVVWDDTTYNEAPQRFVWNNDKATYSLIPAEEDRCTILFKKYGDFIGDVAHGEGYAADMWRWAAGTTNPSGYADDMWRAVLREPQEGLPSQKVGTGKSARYVSSLPDNGKLGNRIMATPDHYLGEMLYAVESQEPVDSAGDVRARAQFTINGGWSLEIARHMQTYADDDIEITPNNIIEVAISVVDGATGEKFISGPVALRLL